MPTVAELEQLTALIERLRPLALKQRGELIKAEDWNVLVGAFIQLSRFTVSDDQLESVPPHEHTDQVGIGWLDARLRQIVTGGGLKDPAIEADFRKLRRDLNGFASRLDSTHETFDAFRSRIAELANKGLVQEATLTRLNRKVLGASDDRNDIADLRSSLRTIENEVRRAVEVGALFEDNGQPIDIPELVRRVGEIETLRDRLTRPNGELLDATEFDRRINELQTSLVTESDLTEALAGIRDNLAGGGIDLNAVLDQARAAGLEAADAAVNTLGTELRSTIATRFGEIDPAVEAAVSRATTTVTNEVLAAARADIDRAVHAGDDALRNEIEAALEARIRATTDSLTDRIQAVSSGLENAIAREFESRIPGLLADVENGLGLLNSNVTGLGTRTAASETAIASNRTRIEAGLRAESQARAGLRNDLTQRIDTVDAGIENRIGTEVDGARSILRTDLQASVNAARRDLESKLSETARQSAATEVQVLSTSIRTDVQSVIRQEVDAAMTSVRADINTEVAGLGRRIGGLVAAEVTRVSADIPRLVREEFDAFRPEIGRIVDSQVNGLVIRNDRIVRNTGPFITGPVIRRPGRQ